MIITRSPMRITLGGGGTDLASYYSQHVGFVLSMAVDKYFYTMIRPRSDSKVQVISADYQIIETFDLDDVQASTLDIPRIVMREFNIRKGLNIFMSSEVPPGTGLGSSGSAMVNLIKAMSTLNGIDMSKKEIAELACFLEIDRMKAPVGKQDQYIASYGGVQNLIFQKDGTTEVSQLRCSEETLRQLEENTLIFYTGISRKSSDILSQQSKGSSQTIENLHFIKKLGLQIRDTIIRGDLHRFGELLNEHWVHKKKLASGITNERIDALYSLGMNSGAIGGKLLGAGGGGFLMFYCDGDKTNIRNEMKKQGLSEMAVSVDKNGVKTILNTIG